MTEELHELIKEYFNLVTCDYQDQHEYKVRRAELIEEIDRRLKALDIITTKGITQLTDTTIEERTLVFNVFKEVLKDD